jgi:ferredoxin-NADP reductase
MANSSYGYVGDRRLAEALSATRRAGLGQRLREVVSRVAATAWHRWFFDHHAEFWLRELGTTWSFIAPRARVVDSIDETADTRTLVLAPGRRWPGHRAGQYVPIEIEVDGARVRRCYSISSGGAVPGARRIAITVRRVPGGRASTALHRLRRGAVVGLGPPAGDFVLDAPVAPKLLLVGGGSGITPIMAMIRDLADRRRGETSHARDGRSVIVIHGSRNAGDAIFGAELASLAARFDWLRIHVRRDDDVESGRLDAPGLRTLVPDLADREIFVCGPLGLLEVVTQAARDVGALHRVHQERFVGPAVRRAGAAVAEAVTVALLRTGVEVVATGPGPLLAQLERAGQHPVFGCRMGICHSCRCRKVRGTVEDSVTGVVSSEPDQEIRLCVSLARSDLELAL